MSDQKTKVVVIGAGPGGYAAAFRSADLGCEVTLIDERDTLGGVCLNEGCIPSKTLLHLAEFIQEYKTSHEFGFSGVISNDKLLLNKTREYKNNIINSLTSGLGNIASRRKVKHVKGYAELISDTEVSVNGVTINFDYAIIAVGSSPVSLPNSPINERIWTSTEALELREIPDSLTIIGGGIIGLEMATIYAALGSLINIIEISNDLLPDFDKKHASIVKKSLIEKGCKFYFNTNVLKIETLPNKLTIHCKNDSSFAIDSDIVLSSIGRKSNAGKIGLENTLMTLEKGDIIPVDAQCRTNISNIFAIGDVTGMPMLAHRATHQGKIVAEVISGLKHKFSNEMIPKVAYTSPEIASVGLSESKNDLGIKIKNTSFPWMASGRNLASNGGDGLTTLHYCPDTLRILGGTIVGKNASELLGEVSIAICMGSTLKDVALVMHAHPTISETIAFAAEKALGTLTDL